MDGTEAVPPGEIRVVPRDGVRQRLFVRAGGMRLDLELDRDGFAAGRPIEIREDLSRISFAVESRCGGAHEARLLVRGLPPGAYEIRAGGETGAAASPPSANVASVNVPPGEAASFPISVPVGIDSLPARVDITRRRS
jgi:hypothetical protein